MKRFLKVDNNNTNKKLSRRLSESRFTTCPICFKEVALSLINVHIDNNCDIKKKVPSNPSSVTTTTTTTTTIDNQMHPSKKSIDTFEEDLMIPGLYLIDSFISESEEDALIEYLDKIENHSNPWNHNRISINGPCSSKKWGSITNLKTRQFLPMKHEIPEILMEIISKIQNVNISHSSSRMKSLNLENFKPNEANAISYERLKGHYLRSHCDDRQLSGKILVNLSLKGDAIMTYTRDNKIKKTNSNSKNVNKNVSKRSDVLPDSYDVLLKRRSLQIQTGEVRYDYQHGISNDHLLSDRRVSITFRQNISSP